MPIIQRDSAGHEIEPDQRVAYNRSGDVIRGTVLKVNFSSILVMPDAEFRYNWQRGKPYSRVKNSRGILVLDDA